MKSFGRRHASFGLKEGPWTAVSRTTRSSLRNGKWFIHLQPIPQIHNPAENHVLGLLRVALICIYMPRTQMRIVISTVSAHRHVSIVASDTAQVPQKHMSRFVEEADQWI